VFGLGEDGDQVVARIAAPLGCQLEDVLAEVGSCAVDAVDVEAVEGIEERGHVGHDPPDPRPPLAGDPHDGRDDVDRQRPVEGFHGLESLLSLQVSDQSADRAFDMRLPRGDLPWRERAAHQPPQPRMGLAVLEQHPVAEEGLGLVRQLAVRAHLVEEAIELIAQGRVARGKDLLALVVATNEPLAVGTAMGDGPVLPHALDHGERIRRGIAGERVTPRVESEHGSRHAWVAGQEPQGREQERLEPHGSLLASNHHT